MDCPFVPSIIWIASRMLVYLFPTEVCIYSAVIVGHGTQEVEAGELLDPRSS